MDPNQYDLMQQLMMGVAPGQQQANMPSPLMPPPPQQQGPGPMMMPMPETADEVAPAKEIMKQRQKISGPIFAATAPERPIYDELQHALMAKQAQGIEGQRTGLKGLEDQINGMQKPTLDPITAALFAGSDIINGTKFTPQVLQQMDAQKAQHLAAQQGLQKSRNDLSDKEIDLLKAQAQFKKENDTDARMNKHYDEQMSLERQKLALARDKSEKEKPEQDLKDPQVQSALYGKRMQQAEDVFQNLSKDGYNRASRGQQFMGMLPAEAQSSELVQQSQAERNFVNAVLRKESGAAISESEFKSAEQQYFPRPGDDDKVLAQKEANRQQAILGMKVGAGRAWDKLPQIGSQVAMPGKASGKPATVTQNGHTYTLNPQTGEYE